ncbi:acyltransferase [Agreia sp. VKM Ac-1783]|uniref:acyltransferase family protein n=1 Tax=Agreia sp. VKM Ac-1783 TaxID=1938889 RepID=UPI000A2AC9B2|nr:acyltransferase [Agreia sp. VKM Ac-1783]SMQ58396.1 Peptidoglycan/LPS O-acetylase OafA/YrhL, contains acyltransferase and SGNH-hydrolase domains [Agreia sp. VKM Ac-1783]
MSNKPGGRLDSLTGLRFFAALAVFGSHAVWRLPESSVKSALETVTTQGFVGVSFFFILSGFVLAWSHRDGDTLRSFYRRRFARIMPAYWTVLVFAVAWHLFVSNEPISRTIGNDALSFVGLQSWIPVETIYFGGNGPGWSLSDELFFYALFPLIFLLISTARNRWIVGGVSVAAIALVPILLNPVEAHTTEYWAVYVFPVQRITEFALGMILAKALRSGWRFPIGLLPAIVFAVVAYVLAGVVPLAFGLVAVTLIPFVILIGAAAQNDLDERHAWLRTPALKRLGEWSYAFYLVHALTLTIVTGIAMRVAPDLFATSTPFALVALLASLIVATTAAIALYFLVEKPLEKRLRGERPRPAMLEHPRQ